MAQISIGTMAIKLSANNQGLIEDFNRAAAIARQGGQKIGRAAGAGAFGGQFDEAREFMRAGSLVAGKGTVGLMMKAAAAMGAMGSAALGLGVLVRTAFSGERAAAALERMTGSLDRLGKTASDALAPQIEAVTRRIANVADSLNTSLGRMSGGAAGEIDWVAATGVGQFLLSLEALAGVMSVVTDRTRDLTMGMEGLGQWRERFMRPPPEQEPEWRQLLRRLREREIPGAGPGAGQELSRPLNILQELFGQGAAQFGAMQQARQAGEDVTEWSRQLTRANREMEHGADAARIMELRLRGATEAQIEQAQVALRERDRLQQVQAQAQELNQLRDRMREATQTPLQLFEREMENLRRSGLEGPQAERAAQTMIENLERALGIGAPLRMAEAAEAGSVQAASILNRWRMQQTQGDSPEERLRRIQERLLDETERQTRDGANAAETLRRIRENLDRLRVADRR